MNTNQFNLLNEKGLQIITDNEIMNANNGTRTIKFKISTKTDTQTTLVSHNDSTNTITLVLFNILKFLIFLIITSDLPYDSYISFIYFRF